MVHLIVSNFHNRHAIHFEVQIFLRKLLRQLKHELRSCLKILLFKKKRRLLAGTSIILNTLVTFISRFERLSSSLTGDNLQAMFITTLRELIFIDRWGSFLMPDTSCSWPVCSFSCFIIIICVAELDQCWRGPRERRIRVTPRAPYYPYTHILTREQRDILLLCFA